MAAGRVRGRRGRRGSDLIDIHIGQRLRERRRALGLSQAQLAARMGFTPPQVNRYEHGRTRLTAAGLWRAGEALDVVPGYFFEGLGRRSRPPEEGGGEVQALGRRIARYLTKLSPPVRDRLVNFIASLARR
jgi:transcriptional regulator with XRE-family HTH domain